MKQYKELLRKVLEEGTYKEDRTGTGTYSIFGHQMRFDLNQGFPLVTCKFTAFKTMATELVWFINGDTNINWLLKNNCHIWDEWANENGDLGPVYGAMWRRWPSYEVVSAVEYKNVDVTKPNDARYEGATVEYKEIDQLKECISQIKNNPDSRRIIVSAWNPQYLPTERIPKDNPAKGKQALPPCHALFQFYVADGKLSCQLYQRSCDLFLGVPFNIASYALLVHIIAHHCNLQVGDFVWTGGDVHLYSNHIEQAKRALNNETFDLPTLKIVDRQQITIEDYRVDDFVLENYRYAEKIPAKVSV